MKKLFIVLLFFVQQLNAQSSATIVCYDVPDSSNYCVNVAYMFETNPLSWYSYRWSTTPSNSTFDANGSTFGDAVITFTTSGTYTINVVYGTNWGGSVAGATKVINVLSNCTTTGIEQVNLTKNQITIYPNPAQNNFTIETTDAEKQTISIFDVNGKLVLSQNINGKTTIDVSILNAGVYNVNINGTTNKRLVIVK